MTEAPSFPNQVQEALIDLLARKQSELPREECLKVDLHCHDHNSDVPDELIGRLLRLPETWLPTERLVERLRRNDVDVITITNHNNARTCWELQEQGEDVLTGAEFSCTLPDFRVGVHVLAYGFDREQESELLKRRSDLYKFLEFACEHDLPTVLAHPLHFYSPQGDPPLELFDTLGLLFERFEAVNGQRDSRQNLLTASWLETLTEERLQRIAQRTRLRPDAFCRNPLRKSLCGGSDDHMGVFAGTTGSWLHVPNLQERQRSRRLSDLALEALREGRVAPFGSYNEEEKLALAFLDYFCQIALNMKDPGLMRLLLHRGSARDKALALFLSNVMLELQRHRYTMKFLAAFHESLAGVRPGFLDSLMVSRSLRPVIQHIDTIASEGQKSSRHLLQAIRRVLPQLFRDLNLILAGRMTQNLKSLERPEAALPARSPALVERFELPTQLRSLFSNNHSLSAEGMTSVDLAELFDGLSFPALASFVIAGSTFAGSRVLHHNRKFLNRFSERYGDFHQPRKALWLTDSLDDQNGVSTALRSILREVQRREAPIDFLVCRRDVAPQPHLRALPPVAEFSLPVYRNQIFRVPDLLELHRTFRQGGYERILCSTELIMGPLALYLKQAFSAPAFFYLHTDWLEFADKTLQLDPHNHDRVRRMLRAFYRGFDGVFTLNTEQQEWLSSPSMGISRDRIFRTAHWADSQFRPQTANKAAAFPGTHPDDPVLLFVGRLSGEKGVFELPEIFSAVRKRIPRSRLVIVGDGPARTSLERALPDAIYLGWVDSAELPRLYSAADLFVFPSRFDTFGCAVLEAMSCGLPVIAYNTKGPRDLIVDGKNGFLVESRDQFVPRITAFLKTSDLRQSMRAAALQQSLNYRPDRILSQLFLDVGLTGERRANKGATDEHSPSQDTDLVIPAPQQNFLEELLEMVGGS